MNPAKKMKLYPSLTKKHSHPTVLIMFSKKKKKHTHTHTHAHTTLGAPTADMGYVPNIAFGTYPTPNTI